MLSMDQGREVAWIWGAEGWDLPVSAGPRTVRFATASQSNQVDRTERLSVPSRGWEGAVARRSDPGVPVETQVTAKGNYNNRAEGQRLWGAGAKGCPAQGLGVLDTWRMSSAWNPKISRDLKDTKVSWSFLIPGSVQGTVVQGFEHPGLVEKCPCSWHRDEIMFKIFFIPNHSVTLWFLISRPLLAWTTLISHVEPRQRKRGDTSGISVPAAQAKGWFDAPRLGSDLCHIISYGTMVQHNNHQKLQK